MVKREAYKLQKGDNLYIDLSSLDPETKEIIGGNTQATAVGPGAKYKNVYQINNNGEISLQEIGTIKAEGYTTIQLSDTLNKQFNRYFNLMNIQVRLADGFITILGEVNSPGRYQLNYKEKLNIYELIGLAGDLKQEANRQMIKIVRQNNDQSEVYLIDITKEGVLSSDLYYLQAGDIVYIEPLEATFWESKSFPFMSTVSILLSTVTSLLVIFTYAKK